jgi:outer membrane protein assembly factor BamB
MNRKFFTITLILLAAYLLSACAGGTGLASSWPGLAVNEDTVYMANNQHVYAINLADGTEKWRFPAAPDNQISFYAPPTITPDGQLLAGGYNKVLYSLNPDDTVQAEEVQTIQENWTFTEAGDRFIGGSLAREEGIFAPSADNHLYALDLEGKLRWKFSTGEPLWARPTTDADCACIYLPSMDHHIYALDAATGNQIWKSEDLGGSVVGSPALSPDGVLYAGSFGNQMAAIDSETGKILWRTPTSGWVWSGPVLHEDRLYFGDLEGTFYVLDAKTGEITNQSQHGSPIPESPIVAGEQVFFTTDAGLLYAVDLNGAPVWNKTIQGENGRAAKLSSGPVLAGDRILLAPMNIDKQLIAMDMEGNEVWSFTPQK